MVLDIVSGAVEGLFYAGLFSVPILLLAALYRYIADEKFPTGVAIVIGLGFLGLTGGLTDLVRTPSAGGVARILIASLVLAWVVKMGDKLGIMLPHKRGSIVKMLTRVGRKPYVTVRMPEAQFIRDIAGKPKVPDELKKELAGSQFILPTDLPMDGMVTRLKRRIVTDWGVGDVEIELNERHQVSYIAVAGREQGISTAIKEGYVALPLRYERVPAGVAPGDSVTLYLKSGDKIESTELLGLDRERSLITVLVRQRSLEKLKDQEASLVVALPTYKHVPNISEVMSSPALVFRPEDDVKKILQAMVEQRATSSFVVDQTGPIGIITERDALEKFALKDAKGQAVQARDVMSPVPGSVSPDTPVDEAMELLRTKVATKLPVVKGSEVVGYVSLTELFKQGMLGPVPWLQRAGSTTRY